MNMKEIEKEYQAIVDLYKQEKNPTERAEDLLYELEDRIKDGK